MKGLGAPKLLGRVTSAIADLLHAGVIGGLESQYKDRGHIGPYRGHAQSIKRGRPSGTPYRTHQGEREKARRLRQRERHGHWL